MHYVSVYSRTILVIETKLFKIHCRLQNIIKSILKADNRIKGTAYKCPKSIWKPNVSILTNLIYYEYCWLTWSISLQKYHS